MSDEWKKFYRKDFHLLDESELNETIKEIKDFREEKMYKHGFSASECNMLLAIICSEKNARSSSSLAKLAIFISILAVILALFMGFFQMKKPTDLSSKTIEMLTKSMDSKGK